jgi:hypothetical protein
VQQGIVVGLLLSTDALVCVYCCCRGMSYVTVQQVCGSQLLRVPPHDCSELQPPCFLLSQ